jgi:hypothetical protein
MNSIVTPKGNHGGSNGEKTVTSDELIQSWRSRLRKLLPQLQLEYPDDAVMRHLSNLIGATDPTFSNSIKSIILDAHLNDAAQRKASDVEIAALLKKVKSQAVALQELLSRLDIGAEGSAYQAGLRLEFALDTQRANGSLDLIPEYIRILENLTAAAEAAEKRVRPKKGPKGAGGNPAFDRFIESLEMQARQRNRKWTIYRSCDGTWSGTLLEAVRILKPYLPSGFLPNPDPGRSIENIRSKLKTHITENTTSRG